MKILITRGAGAGREVRLDGGLLTIGRGADRDLVLQEQQASRSHAELRRYGDRAGPAPLVAQWLLVDTGSTNGTFVNGQRLQPHHARPLVAGEEVAIGDTRFVLVEEPRDRERIGEHQMHVDRGDPHLHGAAPSAASAAWTAARWLGRFAAAIGATFLIIGSLSEWIQVRVQLPVLPISLDRGFGGADSGQSGWFLALGAVALLLVLLDVASQRFGWFGFAAGLGQALLGSAIVVAAAVQIKRYYEAATQEYLGISLLDIFTEYARDYVSISVRTGLYFLGCGLALVIVGGLLRLVVGGLEPSSR